MEALSDPRAYLSNQEKRAEQLKRIGIDEGDISTVGVIMGAAGPSTATMGIAAVAANAAGGAGSIGGATAASAAAAAAAAGVGKGAKGGKSAVGGLLSGMGKKTEEKEEVKFESITADTLKQEKGYLKVLFAILYCWIMNLSPHVLYQFNNSI